MPIIAPAAEWESLSKKLREAAPEAFDSEGRILNLFDGEWKHPGFGRHYESAIDGRSLGRIPMLDLDSALAAVKFAKSEAHSWSGVDLDERRRRVTECLDGLKQQRELIALLLMWEIGKPYAQALTDIDRCISGVAWYVENIPAMLTGRAPLGLISNIASWNYPMSVLMHAVLVQVLAGNAAISKTPSDGGLYALSLAHAIARRVGLPVSLVSGSGGQLSEALVRNEFVDCLAFVGGKTNGGVIASTLYDEKNATCWKWRELTPTVCGSLPIGRCLQSSFAKALTTASSAALLTFALSSSASYSPSSSKCIYRCFVRCALAIPC